mgnify:CR=1 FL=1
MTDSQRNHGQTVHRTEVIRQTEKYTDNQTNTFTYNTEQGQTVHRTEVVDKSDKTEKYIDY